MASGKQAPECKPSGEANSWAILKKEPHYEGCQLCNEPPIAIPPCPESADGAPDFPLRHIEKTGQSGRWKATLFVGWQSCRGVDPCCRKPCAGLLGVAHPSFFAGATPDGQQWVIPIRLQEGELTSRIHSAFPEPFAPANGEIAAHGDERALCSPLGLDEEKGMALVMVSGVVREGASETLATGSDQYLSVSSLCQIEATGMGRSR